MTDYILNQYIRYPQMEIEDIFKFIYQGAFGCEHMVTSLDNATMRIEEESRLRTGNGCIEELSDEYIRIPISYVSDGLTPSTLGKLFYLSAKTEAHGQAKLEEGLKTASELILSGKLNFSYNEFTKKVDTWRKNGYNSLHHSSKFRSLYNPHYRVVSRRFLSALPLFLKIDSLPKNEKSVIAIDGGSGSGKTTLAALICEIYGATVFHMDDFFLTPEMRTEKRLSEPGGNVDRERFESEVLLPLSCGMDVCYKVFDCSVGAFKMPTVVKPKNLTVIEGAYSMHPQLSTYYDFSVFLDISEDRQRERILKRNPTALASRFFNEWIPLENIYFEKTNIRSRCDLIISIN